MDPLTSFIVSEITLYNLLPGDTQTLEPSNTCRMSSLVHEVTSVTVLNLQVSIVFKAKHKKSFIRSIVVVSVSTRMAFNTDRESLMILFPL